MKRHDDELNEELRFHLEKQIEEYIANGLSREEARRRALVALGAPQAVREECRDLRWSTRVEILLQDFRYAVRTLRRSRGFTLVALAMLGLGLGAAITVFSVFSSTLLRRPQFRAAERIVLVWGRDPRAREGRSQVSFTDIDDLRHQNRVFEEVANFADWTPTLSGAGEAERIHGTQVGDGFFQVVGARPLLGRFFRPEEQIDGKDNVVVLSYGLWQRRFGGDPAIVGKTIVLATVPHQVVGILPADFPGLPSTLVEGGELYRPVAEAHDDTQRSSQHLRAIALLKAGVSLPEAQRDADQVAARLARSFPEQDSGLAFRVVGLHDDTVAGLAPAVIALGGAMAALLLLLCVNLANLLLVRAAGKAREFSLRAALGARRGRLLRQTLAESVTLSLGGAIVGISLAALLTQLIALTLGRLDPQLAVVSLDGKSMLFAAVMAIVTGMGFGLAPALSFSSAHVYDALKAGARSVAGGSQRVQSALVVVQVALALALLIASGLLIRSFEKLVRVDPGFEAGHRLSMNVWIPFRRYQDPEKNLGFYRQLLDRTRSLPGVTGAGLVQNPPMGNFDERGFEIEGQPHQPGILPQGQAYFVTPGYFPMMGVRLLAGREIGEHDVKEAPPVVVVSRSLAEKYWPGANPVGKRMRFPGTPGKPNRWSEVVGVVSDVKHFGLDRPAPPAMYVAFEQSPVTWMTMIVSFSGDPQSLTTAIRREIQRIDPDVAAFKIVLLSDLLDDSLAIRRFTLLVIAGFAASALLLAILGIYGVISYGVLQRTQEIGVRMALGALPAQVLHTILKRGLILASLGAAIGAPLAVASSSLVSTMLFAVSPFDPYTIAGVVVLLLASALAGTLFPAFRATRISPMAALRYE